jgi:hypothetical protein
MKRGIVFISALVAAFWGGLVGVVLVASAVPVSGAIESGGVVAVVVFVIAVFALCLIVSAGRHDHIHMEK